MVVDEGAAELERKLRLVHELVQATSWNEDDLLMKRDFYWIAKELSGRGQAVVRGERAARTFPRAGSMLS